MYHVKAGARLAKPRPLDIDDGICWGGLSFAVVDEGGEFLNRFSCRPMDSKMEGDTRIIKAFAKDFGHQVVVRISWDEERKNGRIDSVKKWGSR